MSLGAAADSGAAARSQVAAAGGTEVRELPGSRISTLTARKRDATRLWDTLTAPATARAAAPVDKVWLDGKVKATLDVSVPQIGAPAAWAAGHTGTGATVAVLDTGLDTTHPDFGGAVAGSQDFTETGSTADDNGHGTHVASIVTGSGAASAGRYAGVAPDAKLLVGKVLDAYGSGFESWILAGMEWAALVLDLTADLRGADGSAAPAGLVALSATTLTVPAGGTAAVTVTLRTSGDIPDGRYAGLLTATGRDGHTVVRTAVAVDREVESYEVTVTARDRSGALTPNYDLWFVNLDLGTSRAPYDESGTVVARLPKGRYFLESWLFATDGPEVAITLEPSIVVDRDTSLTVDARRGRTPVLRSPRPAEVGRATLSYDLETGNGGVLAWILAPSFDDILLVPSRTSGRPGEFTVGVEGVLARPDGSGGFRGSPYQYHLAWSAPDRVPADLSRSYRDRDLGVSRTTIAGSGLTAVKDSVAQLALPATLTELYSPGHDWFGDVTVHAGPPAETAVTAFWVNSLPRRYAAGSRTAERWGGAVVGPVLPSAPDIELQSVVRYGDVIVANVPMHGDSAGHPGYVESTGTATLHRDGVLVEPVSGGAWEVPPDPAAYRLEMTATGAGVAGLSTDVSAVWRFRSATAEVAALPVLAVRFDPPVDARNSARAGRPFAVPVRVTTQAGARYGRLRPPVVEVSCDGGTTWRRAPVVAGSARLRHPAGARSVSLRATATDTAGNSVRQTVLRAYRLR